MNAKHKMGKYREGLASLWSEVSIMFEIPRNNLDKYMYQF